jgi:glutathione S-transferase
MKLYQFPYSHYSAKVKIVLLEKGLVFEAPALSATDLHSPEFLALNPLGKVPFLQDGDFGIGESEVIVEYLEDRYPEPSLLPSTPEARARSRWLSRFHDLYLGPQLSTLYFALSDGRVDKPEFAKEVDRLHELVALLEAKINPAPYFLGMQFTLADASFVLSYWYIGMLSQAHGKPVPDAAMPLLVEWFAAVKKRASVASVLEAAEASLTK